MACTCTALRVCNRCRTLRADTYAVSLEHSKWGPRGSLSPVQLAAYLGDHRIFQHLMRKRSSVLWVWGPVTSYQVSLAGIDSQGKGDNDVMDLVARRDANDKAREMLGDEFMLCAL